MTSMTVYLSGLLVLTEVIMEENSVEIVYIDCVILLAAFKDTTITWENTTDKYIVLFFLFINR